MTRYAMAIDQRRCIGCHSCSVACRTWNELPLDIIYNPVLGSAFVRLRFGAKRYPLNLAILNFCVLPAAIINIAISAILGPDARLEFFAIAVINVVIALVIALVFRRMWGKDFADVDSVKK